LFQHVNYCELLDMNDIYMLHTDIATLRCWLILEEWVTVDICDWRLHLCVLPGGSEGSFCSELPLPHTFLASSICNTLCLYFYFV